MIDKEKLLSIIDDYSCSTIGHRFIDAEEHSLTLCPMMTEIENINVRT